MEVSKVGDNLEISPQRRSMELDGNSGRHRHRSENIGKLINETKRNFLGCLGKSSDEPNGNEIEIDSATYRKTMLQN